MKGEEVMMGYYGYGMGAFGWIGMLLFWALIIIGIVYLVRHLNLQNSGQEAGKRSSSRETDSAMEILRERFARGEIDKEEFEERRRGLL